MELLGYYLKVNLVFTVLFLTYVAVFRREAWFTGRRLWLLGSAVVAFLLPLLPVPADQMIRFTYTLPAQQVYAVGVETIASWSGLAMIINAHVAVTLVLLVLLIVRSARTVRTMAELNEASSFFGRVHIPTGHSPEDHETMRRHEEVHARQGHSYDVVLYEAFIAFCWTNPVWRMALRELRLVHEHAADSEARAFHRNYGAFLVSRAFGASQHELVNRFGSSNLKTRLDMMNNDRTPKSARPRMFFAFPAVLIATALISWQAVPITGLTVPPTDQETRTQAEQMPEFPGGNEALMKYLGSNVVYPKAAAKEGVEGTVFVAFVVKADGKVAEAKVKRGAHADLDAEALRVIRAMPDWKPGADKGKKIAVEMVVPIAFRLSDGDK